MRWGGITFPIPLSPPNMPSRAAMPRGVPQLQPKWPAQATVIQPKDETTGDRLQPSLEPQPSQPNKTGLPDALKAGVEQLSGYSLDQVNVHYNSPKPAQLQAYAYTQGTEIHVAPGQERHLPHEAWHVVQQAQGRVQPTMQMKAGVPLNADQQLEQEADVMGAKALSLTQSQDALTPNSPTKQPMASGSQSAPVQLLSMTRDELAEKVGEEKLKPKHITYQILEAMQFYENTYNDVLKSSSTNAFSSENLERIITALKPLQQLCSDWLPKAKHLEEKKVSPVFIGKKKGLKKTRVWIDRVKPTIEKLQQEVAQEILFCQGSAVGYVGKGDDAATVKYVLGKGAHPLRFTSFVNSAKNQMKFKRTSWDKDQYQALPDEELQAVILYTGQPAYAMNAILRGLLKSDYWEGYKQWIEPAKRGLAKLPGGARNFQQANPMFATGYDEAKGKSPDEFSLSDDLKKNMLTTDKPVDAIIDFDTVYRADYWGDAFNQAFANRYQVGRTFEEPAFLSTSLVKGSYDGGLAPVNLIITNVKNQAKSLLDLSQFAAEKEALLPPGSRFQVTKITYSLDGQTKDCKKPTQKFPDSDQGQTAFNQPGLKWEITMKLLQAPASGEKPTAPNRPKKRTKK